MWSDQIIHTDLNCVGALFCENGNPFVADATFPLLGEFPCVRPWKAVTFTGRTHGCAPTIILNEII